MLSDFRTVILTALATIVSPVLVYGQAVTFPKTVPPGDYSGITWMGHNRYAVACDKSKAGFFVFEIDIDSVSGRIRSVSNEGFRSCGLPCRDQEGIAWFSPDSTMFICGEKDNEVLEYDAHGCPTGRRLQVPLVFKTASSNLGIESLTYNAHTQRFWITSESTLPADGDRASSTNRVVNLLRLQSFDTSLAPAEYYYYKMDMPEAKRPAAIYAMGVSELCALDDGKLLVLEREFFVPKRKIGAWVNCKLFVVNPKAGQPETVLQKSMIRQIHTKLNLTNRSLANYEGMCLGPRLKNGKRVVVMVSDSQHRYKKLLKDWFLTLTIPDGQ